MDDYNLGYEAGYKDGANHMLESIRSSIRARVEGTNIGGDIVVMELIDQLLAQNPC